MNASRTITFTLPSVSSLAPFVLAVLGFFMLFTDINCNGESIARFTGFDLVTGNGEILDPAEGDERNEPNIWAIIALTAGLAGVVLYTVLKAGQRRKSLLLAGITGVAAMIALYYDIQTSIQSDNDTGNDPDFDINVDIHADMKFGFWFVLACFVLAVLLNLDNPKKEAESTSDIIPENNS